MSSSSESTAGIPVSTTAGTAVSNAANQRNVSSELDKDAFLKLLIAQLQNQDPLEPMDNTEFVSQMAQFSALEQMQNLNSTMTASQAYSIIGKDVYAVAYNESTNAYEEIQGTVEYVSIKNSTPYLSVNGTEISFSDIQYVYGSSGTSSSTSTDTVVNQALSLVGKTIQAITVDDDLEATGFIEGKVDYVKFVDGAPVLSVGGKDVSLYEVVSVSDNQLLIGNQVSAYVNSETVISGTIDDISINGESLYAVIDGNKILIQDLSSLMNALAYVGKTVSTGDVSGIAESVIINKSIPYLVVDGQEISLDDIK